MPEPTAAPRRRQRPPTGSKKYTVVAAAISVRTGRKDEAGKPEIIRMTKAQSIVANPNDPKIKALVRQGAVMDAAETPILLTARRASSLMGAPDDPVAKPVEGVEPLDARVASREGLLNVD